MAWMNGELKEIAAALAHDLNNYLQVVMGNLELLRRRREFAPEIVEAALAASSVGSACTLSIAASARRAGASNSPPRPAPARASGSTCRAPDGDRPHLSSVDAGARELHDARHLGVIGA